MEDNAGYSFGERVNEIIERKKVSVNGKRLHIPRKLSDRIFSERVKDIRSSKEFLCDNGEVRISYRDKYRYKPTSLSRCVSDTIQYRLLQDFDSELRSAEVFKGSSLDFGEVDSIVQVSISDLENREALQARFFRQGFQKAKI